MKTPVQKFFSRIRTQIAFLERQEDTDRHGWKIEYLYSILEKEESLLEEEKKAMCEFAIDYTMQVKTAYDFHRAKFNNEL